MRRQLTPVSSLRTQCRFRALDGTKWRHLRSNERSCKFLADKFAVLCAFRKIANSDYQLRRVCLSVQLEGLGSCWKDFHENYIWEFFENLSKKIQVSLSSDNNNRYFTWWLMYFYGNISLNSSWNEKYVGQDLESKSKHRFLQHKIPHAATTV